MIDESYGIWPHDEGDLSWPLDADSDDDDPAGDTCQHWDNRREERRINR